MVSEAFRSPLCLEIHTEGTTAVINANNIKRHYRTLSNKQPPPKKKSKKNHFSVSRELFLDNGDGGIFHVGHATFTATTGYKVTIIELKTTIRALSNSLSLSLSLSHRR
jgi:hypothetical protein